MYHLKLIKSLSYTGVVTATKKNPDAFVEDKATADTLVATGYFKLVGEAENTPGGAADTSAATVGHLDEAELAEMKFDDLKRLAADMGVDTKGLKSKVDYAKAIAAVEVTPGTEEDGPDAGGEENEVDYGEGSPTMVELQEQ